MKTIFIIFLVSIINFVLGIIFIKLNLMQRIKLIKFKKIYFLFLISVMVSLYLGILIGRFTKKTGYIQTSGPIISDGSKAKPFSKPQRMPFSGNVFVLSNFENGADLKKWEASKARLELSNEHVKEGRFSGKMTFEGNVQAPKIAIEDYLDNHREFGNWSNFKLLKFDIFNPEPKTQRLILKIKDSNGKSLSRSLYLQGEDTTEVNLYIDELRQGLDVSSIRQFNLFRWNPRETVVFYIDNIRLLTSDVSESNPESQSTTLDSLEIEESNSKLSKQVNQENAAEVKTLDIPEGLDYIIAIQNNLEKVFRSKEDFKGELTDKVEISLARNEYEATQLVFFSKKPLNDIKIEVEDLVNSEDNLTKIGKANVRCFVAGFVNINGKDWPDPLVEKDIFDIKEGILQSIWVSVFAPEGTKAGRYSGKLIIKPQNAEPKTINLSVNIWDFTLPKETHLKTAFDFYGSRLRVAYPKLQNENPKDYNNRIYALQNKYYLDMLGHRISPIFNFDLGKDFAIRDVQFYVKIGLSAFAIGRYGGSFGNNWPKSPDELKRLIPVYRDYAQILKANKLIDKAYIYSFDEPRFGNPRAEEITKMVHKASPDLKNLVCVHELEDPDKFIGWGNDIDIWCVRNAAYNEKLAKKYKDRGKEVWIYVSGPERPYPTLVIDYPSIAYRIITWMCWKYSIKGYLYWCVNFWNEDFWHNPKNTKWDQYGNGALYYPGEDGAVTSIRLEVIRDSLEDYEYLYLLDQKMREAEAKGLDTRNKMVLEKAKELLNIDGLIVNSMADYTKNPEIIYKRRLDIAELIEGLEKILSTQNSSERGLAQKKNIQVIEDFSKPIEAVSGKSFGDYGQLTFELYRNGTFVIDGNSGFAWQKSNNYKDVAIIRSTNALPKTYKLSVAVGDIDYDLNKIEGLPQDAEYKEGPQNENGCYLLAIADEIPTGHYTNDWWHQHRKVCIDIDNNIWGSGMPHPIFMVYFDRDNNLLSFNGKEEQWQYKWKKAITYEPQNWYRVEIEKTESKFILSIYNEKEVLLKRSALDLKDVWHEDGNYPDYLVIGDPHENYYQGSMKIKSVSMPVEIKQEETKKLGG